MSVCEWVSGQSFNTSVAWSLFFILKMGSSIWPCPCFWRELDCTASNFRGLLGSFYIVKRHLKCVQNLRSRSDVSKNGVKKSNWIKNDRLMELWKFLTFTNPSSDGGTHIQWSIMFHVLSYQQSSQIQVLSSDQPKLLSRFVIVDDHFIRNIIQHLTKIVDQLPHHPQFWKNSSRTQGLGEKAFFREKKNQKPANFFLRLPDTCKKYILQKKMGQNGTSRPRQWSEQSTDGYMGSQPPTRWSTQKSKYK